eukprot:jgi/Mesvir1/17993/Mv09335-RA.1
MRKTGTKFLGSAAGNAFSSSPWRLDVRNHISACDLRACFENTVAKWCCGTCCLSQGALASPADINHQTDIRGSLTITTSPLFRLPALNEDGAAERGSCKHVAGNVTSSPDPLHPPRCCVHCWSRNCGQRLRRLGLLIAYSVANDVSGLQPRDGASAGAGRDFVLPTSPIPYISDDRDDWPGGATPSSPIPYIASDSFWPDYTSPKAGAIPYIVDDEEEDDKGQGGQDQATGDKDGATGNEGGNEPAHGGEGGGDTQGKCALAEEPRRGEMVGDDPSDDGLKEPGKGPMGVGGGEGEEGSEEEVEEVVEAGESEEDLEEEDTGVGMARGAPMVAAGTAAQGGLLPKLRIRVRADFGRTDPARAAHGEHDGEQHDDGGSAFYGGLAGDGGSGEGSSAEADKCGSANDAERDGSVSRRWMRNKTPWLRRQRRMEKIRMLRQRGMRKEKELAVAGGKAVQQSPSPAGLEFLGEVSLDEEGREEGREQMGVMSEEEREVVREEVFVEEEEEGQGEGEEEDEEEDGGHKLAGQAGSAGRGGGSEGGHSQVGLEEAREAMGDERLGDEVPEGEGVFEGEEEDYEDEDWSEEDLVMERKEGAREEGEDVKEGMEGTGDGTKDEVGEGGRNADDEVEDMQAGLEEEKALEEEDEKEAALEEDEEDAEEERGEKEGKKARGEEALHSSVAGRSASLVGPVLGAEHFSGEEFAEEAVGFDEEAVEAGSGSAWGSDASHGAARGLPPGEAGVDDRIHMCGIRSPLDARDLNATLLGHGGPPSTHQPGEEGEEEEGEEGRELEEEGDEEEKEEDGSDGVAARLSRGGVPLSHAQVKEGLQPASMAGRSNADTTNSGSDKENSAVGYFRPITDKAASRATRGVSPPAGWPGALSGKLPEGSSVSAQRRRGGRNQSVREVRTSVPTRGGDAPGERRRQLSTHFCLCFSVLIADGSTSGGRRGEGGHEDGLGGRIGRYGSNAGLGGGRQSGHGSGDGDDGGEHGLLSVDVHAGMLRVADEEGACMLACSLSELVLETGLTRPPVHAPPGGDRDVDQDHATWAGFSRNGRSWRVRFQSRHEKRCFEAGLGCHVDGSGRLSPAHQQRVLMSGTMECCHAPHVTLQRCFAVLTNAKLYLFPSRTSLHPKVAIWLAGAAVKPSHEPPLPAGRSDAGHRDDSRGHYIVVHGGSSSYAGLGGAARGRRASPASVTLKLASEGRASSWFQALQQSAAQADHAGTQ